jgi:hypothetical protein
MNTLIRDHTSLILSINTFANVEHETALWFVKTAEEQLLLTYVERANLKRLAYYRKFGYEERERKFRGGKVNWELLKTFQPLGQIQLLYYDPSPPLPGQYPSTSSAALTCHMGDSPHTVHRHIAKSFELSAEKHKVYGGAISEDIQRQIVSLGCETFERVNGNMGYIGFGGMLALGGGNSPYETKHFIPATLLPIDLADRVRGVYWGNFVDDQHAELLGGYAALKQAPVFLVEKLRGGYYLQLNRDINDVSDEQLSKLEQFFKPLLPTIRRPRVP